LIVGRDVDARRARDERQQIFDGSVEVRRDLDARIEPRDRRGLRGLLAQIVDARARSRRLDLIANLPLDLERLRDRERVAGIEIGGEPVLGGRAAQLILLLERPRALEMIGRRVAHRSLERELDVDAARIAVERLAVVRDGGVPVALVRGGLSAAHGLSCRAAGDNGHRHRDRAHPDDSCQHQVSGLRVSLAAKAQRPLA
jgi:hypothetical protein